MKIALLHGFNVSDGGHSSLARWRDALVSRGHDAFLVDYGWVGPLRVRLESMEVVNRLIRLLPDVIIGHSNGAAIGWLYAQRGPRLRAVVNVQPALNTETRWPTNVRNVITLYNPKDRATIWGRRWRMLNPVSWFYPHYWGAAGNMGFEHIDNRFTQINTMLDPIAPYKGHGISKLSDMSVRYWVHRIMQEIEE